MARDGAGTYNLPQPPFVPGTVISSTATNSNNSDIAAALTQSIARDGQTVPTANLPMGTYRHTGVGNAVARTDYAAMGQVQDGAGIWAGTAGGTANALTLTPSPAITAYAAGQVFRFTAGAAANTGATTVAVSGLTAQAVQNAGAALTGGEIAAGRQYSLLYDGANFQLSPFASSTPGASSITTAMLQDGAITARKESDDPWSSVASAATVDLGAINSRNALITGTTTITSFGNTGTEGRTIRVRFAAALTLTHNATTLILPGSVNRTTAAGDTAIFIKETGASAWRCVDYQRADGQAVVTPTPIFSVQYDSGDQTITSAGSLVLAHSLGASPKIVFCLIRCVTAEHNYSINDLLPIGIGTVGDAGSSSANVGVSVVPDSTNLNVRFGSATGVFFINNKTTGVPQFITNANWRFIARAYA